MEAEGVQKMFGQVLDNTKEEVKLTNTQKEQTKLIYREGIMWRLVIAIKEHAYMQLRSKMEIVESLIRMIPEMSEYSRVNQARSSWQNL